MNIVEEETEGSCLLAVYDGIVLKVRNLCIMKPAKFVRLVAFGYMQCFYSIEFSRRFYCFDVLLKINTTSPNF